MTNICPEKSRGNQQKEWSGSDRPQNVFFHFFVRPRQKITDPPRRLPSARRSEFRSTPRRRSYIPTMTTRYKSKSPDIHTLSLCVFTQEFVLVSLNTQDHWYLHFFCIKLVLLSSFSPRGPPLLPLNNQNCTVSSLFHHNY